MKEDLTLDERSTYILMNGFRPEDADYFILLENCIPRRLRVKLEARIPRRLRNIKGKKIHINSRQGIYTVEGAYPNGIEISCKRWSYEVQKTRIVPFDDFKCFAGGKWN